MENKKVNIKENSIIIKSNNCDDNLSISETISKLYEHRGISKSVSQVMAGYIKNLNICSKFLTEELKKYNAMYEPIKKITNQIIENNNIAIKGITSAVTQAFKNIDFTQLDYIFKTISIIYLSNGFYPYRNNTIVYEELLATKNRHKQCMLIKASVKNDIKINKLRVLKISSNYKSQILQVYSLYEEQEYRLCILSLMNLVATITNSVFKYIDYSERKNIRQKLLEKHIIKEKETNYMLFSPYIEDKYLEDANKILQNNRNNTHEYKNIPYNRHAIVHGYSSKFGYEIHCLRWFSVLLNTMEILEEVKKIEISN